MIHTIRIIKEIYPKQIPRILSGFGFKKSIEEITQTGIETVNLSKRYPASGIKYISVICYITNYGNCRGLCKYYCLLGFEPQMMLLGKRTMTLYTPTDDHNLLLSSIFSSTLFCFLGDNTITNDLLNLSSWIVSRIDYSFNLRFNSDTEVRHFLALTKKTSLYQHTNQQRIEKIKLKDQSTAEGNGSYKIICYDKKKQVEETYNGISDVEKQRLLTEANGMVRFEVQCRKGALNAIKEKHHFHDKAIRHYLNADIAAEVLLSKYQTAIGFEDFFSRYHAQKLLNINDDNKPQMKRKLLHLLQLIAQACSVCNAKKQFLKGTFIRNTEIFVHGSKEQFRDRLQRLRSLNINPVLLPKEWHLTFLRNPIHQLYQALQPV